MNAGAVLAMGRCLEKSEGLKLGEFGKPDPRASPEANCFKCLHQGHLVCQPAAGATFQASEQEFCLLSQPQG